MKETKGTLLYIGVEKGQAVPVEGIIAILGEKGEDYESLLKEEKSAKPKEKQDGQNLIKGHQTPSDGD